MSTTTPPPAPAAPAATTAPNAAAAANPDPVSQLFSVKGIVALITGGGTGILPISTLPYSCDHVLTNPHRNRPHPHPHPRPRGRIKDLHPRPPASRSSIRRDVCQRPRRQERSNPSILRHHLPHLHLVHRFRHLLRPRLHQPPDLQRWHRRPASPPFFHHPELPGRVPTTADGHRGWLGGNNEGKRDRGMVHGHGVLVAVGKRESYGMGKGGCELSGYCCEFNCWV